MSKDNINRKATFVNLGNELEDEVFFKASQNVSKNVSVDRYQLQLFSIFNIPNSQYICFIINYRNIYI